MLLKVFVVGLCVGVALSASIDCNIEQCAKPSKLYEELGCKAVYGSKSCCAKRFECPDFKTLDDNKCTFEGKEFNIGETLPRTLASNTKCAETCFCTRQNNEPAKFECTNSDCGISSSKLPGCLNIYGDLNECCSTSIVCDEPEKQTLASCFVGKEYREGEKFIPASNLCYECLCHKEFDNTTITDNPHCRKLNCEIDLKYKSFVQRGCLPVFHSEKCCPVDWECPKTSKKVIKRSADDDSTQTPKQEVFIVTPSKNIDGYEAEVKTSNEADFSITSSESKSINAPKKEPETSTETVTVPTLSTNPFIVPVDEVTVPVKKEEETTKSSIELETSLASVATTNAPTTVSVAPITIAEAPATAALSTTERFIDPSTRAPTEPSTEATTTYQTTTVQETTKILTTPAPSTTEKSSSSEESHESKESNEQNTNLFGEDVDEKNEKSAETTIPSTTTEAVKTTESTQAPSTTESAKEVLKVLEQPEELTTLPEEKVTLATTPKSESTTSAESTSEAPTTTAVTQDQTTQAATFVPNLSDNVSPTEFEKLLTTLRDFVAKVDATSTEASSTSATVVSTTLQEQVEFVNYTVSSEKDKEEEKSISKRSVDDADLIPRYYKQHFSSNKEKVCVFNGRTFKVGEVIRTDNECLKCLCEYAPIGHCILKEKCIA